MIQTDWLKQQLAAEKKRSQSSIRPGDDSDGMSNNEVRRYREEPSQSSIRPGDDSDRWMRMS